MFLYFLIKILAIGRTSHFLFPSISILNCQRMHLKMKSEKKTPQNSSFFFPYFLFWIMDNLLHSGSLYARSFWKPKLIFLFENGKRNFSIFSSLVLIVNSPDSIDAIAIHLKYAFGYQNYYKFRAFRKQKKKNIHINNSESHRYR